MIEQRVQMAFVEDSVSVKHRVCWVTLFNGRLTRFTLFNVAVNQGSTLAARTTLGDDLGAKAAADAGSRILGIMIEAIAFGLVESM
jgi:hypothetical protein